MINRELIEKTTKPLKRIELILIKSRDPSLKKFFNTILSCQSKSDTRRAIIEFIIREAPRKLLSSTALSYTNQKNPLIKLSERVLNILSRKQISEPLSPKISFKPIELFLPPSTSTIIFWQKILSVLSKSAREFLEFLMSKCLSTTDFIATLGIIIYFEQLEKTQRELLTRYFIRTNDFPATFYLASLLHILTLTSEKLIIKTKSPFMRKKYLAGYTIDILPIGTKLIVKEKRGPYYYAKKSDDPLEKTYILHEREVVVIGKIHQEKQKLQKKARELIEKLLKQTRRKITQL